MKNVIERNGHRYVSRERAAQMLNIELDQLEAMPAFKEREGTVRKDRDRWYTGPKWYKEEIIFSLMPATLRKVNEELGELE